MPPRIAPTPPQAVSKVRAEARARKICGAGAMTDIVDVDLLKRELGEFYEECDGSDDVSTGLIALNRAKRALDAIAEVTKGPNRITKYVTRTLWRLLSEELVHAIKRNPATTVESLKQFSQTIKNNGRRPQSHTSWDMGVVRDLLGRGWPSGQSVHKLKELELGPLHWWLAIGALEGSAPVLRQYIHDAAYARHLPESASSRRTSPATASGSTRPARQAANATNATLRDVPILDDDTGSTYAPSEAGPPQQEGGPPQQEDGPPQQWTFGRGTAAEFTAEAPTPAMPPPPPPAAGTTRRAQPSPWLPPTGFSADIKWDVANYNAHEQMLLKYPAGETIPDSLIWQHPNMHGCKVDESGQPVQFRVSCTNCVKRLRRCIYRGSKACLPCFWDKGSMGKCEGGQPPQLTPQEQKESKPEFALRTSFLRTLEHHGKIEYPDHYLDRQGRAKHGAAASGTGRPPAYIPAPGYAAPTQGASTGTAGAQAAGSGEAPAVPPSQPGDSRASPSTRAPQEADTSAATTQDSAPAASPPLRRNAQRQDGEGEPEALEVSGPERVAPSASNDPSASDSLTAAQDLDVTMADVSNVSPPARKRQRTQAVEEVTNTATEPSTRPPPRPRKRMRRESEEENAATSTTTPGTAPVQPVRSPPRTAATSPTGSDDESEVNDTVVSGRGSSAETPGAERQTSAKHAIKGKGKGRAGLKISGAVQRSRMPSATSPMRFSPAPGARTIPRAGSPSEYRRTLTSKAVIPDQDMRIEGDRAFDIPLGVTPISHPKATASSIVNVSGDILLANHVERAMRHESRDIRDQQGDWMVGRFKNEHLMPMHQEIMGSLNMVVETLMSRNAKTVPSAPAVASGPDQNTFVAHAGGLNVGHGLGAASFAPPSHGISEERMLEMLAGVTESMRETLSVQTAPISELKGSLQDVTRRLQEMEPITGRVNEMGDELRSLIARVQRLETADVAMRNVSVVTRQPDPAIEEAPSLFQAGGASRRTTPAPAVSGSPAPVDAAAAPSRHASLEVPATGSPAPMSETQAPALAPSQQQAPGGERVTPQAALGIAPARSREHTPSPAPGASPAGRAGASAFPGSSPLTTNPSTTNPSPGNLVGASPNRSQSAGGWSVSPAGSGGQAAGSEIDEPVETGDDWGAAGSNKRRADVLDPAEGQRSPKRRANGSAEEDEDEDAEGSADEVVAEGPDQGESARTPAPRSKTGRATKGAATKGAATPAVPGTRTGLRARPGRGE
ncbi:hypothetical protein PENSPDRAFT_666249 [Peniophora sp. CONT]|nr:hypothetical protein PENSPDRAFT_666249 [Peniophora sp. CONT]